MKKLLDRPFEHARVQEFVLPFFFFEVLSAEYKEGDVFNHVGRCLKCWRRYISLWFSLSLCLTYTICFYECVCVCVCVRQMRMIRFIMCFPVFDVA